MHCIPKNEERRRAWIRAINRKDFNPHGKEQVCSIHFIDGRPSKQNPDPALHLGYEAEAKPGRRTLIRLPLRPLATQDNMDGQTDSQEYDHSDNASLSDVTNTGLCSSGEEKRVCDLDCQTVPVVCHLETETRPVKKPTCDSSTQTEDFVMIEHCYAMMGPKSKNIGTQHTTEFSASSFTNDSESRFYTGLTLSVFLCLISTLSGFGKKLSFRLPTPDQILLTLMRLRLGLAFKDLGHRFGISCQLSSDIFSSGIDIMDKQLRDCVLCLPRETIRRTMPASFRDAFPKTTCIIDCTEVFIQRPFSLKARAQTWSTYKGHNTAKVLVAIAPNGYIMFISHSYGGRASDNFITKSCGFLDVLRPGDEVMADRGFTIGEDLFARRVKLNIPAFMKGRSQLSEKETVESRRIASVRIHVERAIARLKNYRILNTTLPVRSLKTLDKIIRVCAALCNMHGDLIKENSMY